jgi:hypothetical protein
MRLFCDSAENEPVWSNVLVRGLIGGRTKLGLSVGGRLRDDDLSRRCSEDLKINADESVLGGTVSG